MISLKFTIKSPAVTGLADPKVSLRDDPFLTLGQERMQDLGEYAISVVRDRALKGIGSDDAPMPALKVHPRAATRFRLHGRERALLSYAEWKARHGLQPKRDLFGTGKDGGHMLDNLSVRSVSGRSVVMSITARKARAKAIANEKLAPWLSFSDQDEKKIVAYAQKLFEANVQAVKGQIFARLLRRAA